MILQRKMLLAIKLSAILLLSVVQIKAATRAQITVSFTGKDVPLEQVFAAVKKQSGYTFVYYTEVLQSAHKVTIDVKGLTIEEFLEICLKDEPLTYKVIGQTVMIGKKEDKLITGMDGRSQPPAEIKGRITNEKGEPLSGASIMVKGTKKGTITAADGKFTLRGIAPGVSLVVSYAGFVTKEVKLENSATISLVLEPSNNPLDQVQVIAYGTTTERLNTGDVTIVKADEIEKQPVTDPILALEGRVPGLSISQTTGFAGSGLSIQIQGQNSIQAGNDPFYVIDGVPYTSEVLTTINGVQGASYTGPSPFAFLNPGDIESISILKDADATSIYGSRAANGAILITTKKGKAGQTKVDLNFQTGWGQDTRRMNLLNTSQYLKMREDALRLDGISGPGPTDYDINGLWDSTSYTDWQKKFLGGTAQYTTESGVVSGGTTNTQFLVGGNYHRETTVFPNNFSDQKGSLHFNLNNVSANQKFHIQLTGNYLFDNNRLPPTDLTGTAIELAPDAPSIYNKSGTLNWEPDQNGNSSWYNPLAYINGNSDTKTNNLIANMLLSYRVLPSLDLISSFGYTNLQSTENFTVPLDILPPEQRAYSQSQSKFENNDINSWDIEPQAVYKQIMGQGKLEAILGLSIQQNNSIGQQLTATGFSSDLLLGDIGSASSITGVTTAAAVYRYDAMFGRLTYNWQDKYIINVTSRRDGSSRFGPANQFHDFSSIGLAWVFSKEDWIQSRLHFVSFGKLNFSYGTTGNDQIGNYQYEGTYQSISVPIPYGGAVGLQTGGLANPYLQWEETKKMQVGLELGFDKDRVTLSAHYFSNRSANELLDYNLPVITGFGSIIENFPATIQNFGWEFSLNSKNIDTRRLTWATSFNLTIPRNKLLSFQNFDSSSYASTFIIGKPINIVKVYRFAGVDHNSGEYQFFTSQGQTNSNPDFNTDRTAIENINPTIYGGISNTLRYKRIQLDVFFQFVRQKSQNSFGKFGEYPGTFFGISDFGNQPRAVLHAWLESGDNVSIQRYNSNFTLSTQARDAANSDAAYTDASFIRLKNISLSWDVPVSKKCNFTSFRIYAHVQNLLTFTRYSGLDPETFSSFSLPPLTVATFGCQFVF